MATTNSSSSPVFAGNSRYAQDFQAVIDRSVAIASLPLSQMNNDKTKLTDQASALDALGGKFDALRTAVENLASAVSGSRFDAGISDASKVSATVGDRALEGTYSIEVTDVGAYATSLSASAWDSSGEPDRGKTTYTIVVGAETLDIVPENNSAAAVAAAINSRTGDQVRATVVNVGSTAEPDYRISLRSAKLGPRTLAIRRNGVDQQSAQTEGRPATYIVNGSGKLVSSETRSVEIAPGVTVTMLAENAGSPTSITLTRSSSALGDALSAFAAAYNETRAAVDAHRGTAGGALSGEAVAFDLSAALAQVATYAGEEAGLRSLGLELGNDGKLTFDRFAFFAADLTNSNGISSFLGKAGKGGFLDFASEALDRVSNAGQGLLDSARASVKTSTGAVDARIAEAQSRIDLLRERLQGQMAAADALIASLEQQYSVVYSVFDAMRAQSSQYS